MYSRVVNFIANTKVLISLFRRILRLLGVDIPKTVTIGKRFCLPHGGMGVVIHPSTTIGDDVKIYQQVTIGRADIWNDKPGADFKGVHILDNVIICAGAKIITNKNLKVGRGTIIGANSVLTQSTGENEVWAGIPAVLIRQR